MDGRRNSTGVDLEGAFFSTLFGHASSCEANHQEKQYMKGGEQLY